MIVESAVIKFAGDSGDGIQLAGTLFTENVALMGNAIATFPDFPSEIRAPQGTVAGVSGFQIHFGTSGVHSPGDAPDVLVAMNPAALKANIHALKANCLIIVDADSFGKRDIEKAGFDSNPLEDGTLEGYQVIAAPITSLTKASVAELGLDNKSADRCKNMFTLGLVLWLFNESLDSTLRYFEQKFKKNPVIEAANKKALNAGFNYGLNTEAIKTSFTVLPAPKASGTYRNMTGNQATAWGFMAAAEKAGRPLFLGSYPITPATDIMQELTKHKWSGARVFQAEDEIAGICSAIGAAFAGNIAVTTTSGPGMALKTEAIGLAVMTELPIVIVDVQRGGPSTGLPTKTEQSDLMQAIWGRNGESPVVVLSAGTPSDCFDWAYEAVRIAVEHMTPVFLLTESYLGNGAEPWKIKKLADMPAITPRTLANPDPAWKPYSRDEEKLARYWVIPGTAAMQHRIGGLEKDECTGCVSTNPQNHEKMVKIRKEKIKKIENYIPLQRYKGKDAKKLLVVGWGGQFGILMGAVKELQEEGKDLAYAHFNYINPLPKNTAEVFSKFEKIIVCELNDGQLAKYLRAVMPQFQYEQYNKIQGLPFTVKELKEKFTQLLSEF
ncbi:MAG: 2-oxoacid:acceptor oxidoreductase subunit alpha [Bacteroidetes bacterium]|nr:2-oxoacid:acceptor oxidoreductase subunit alpha [Bacteroidota bacterium]